MSKDDKQLSGSDEDFTELDRLEISSPVLKRLIEEVKNEIPAGPQAYNRIHNRHNRGR